MASFSDICNSTELPLRRLKDTFFVQKFFQNRSKIRRLPDNLERLVILKQETGIRVHQIITRFNERSPITFRHKFYKEQNFVNTSEYKSKQRSWSQYDRHSNFRYMWILCFHSFTSCIEIVNFSSEWKKSKLFSCTLEK